MKRYLFILCFIVCVVFLNAQQENWYVYHSAKSGACDLYSRGSEMWLVSFAGIMCFDTETGEKKQYNELNTPALSPVFFSVCGDDEGNIWVGGESGVMRFDGENWQLYPAGVQPLPLGSVYYIRKDSAGGIWFASKQGMACLNDGIWHTYDSTNSILPEIYTCRDLEPDPVEGIWMATNLGLFMFDGVNFIEYDSAGLAFSYNYISSIAFEQDGRGWFAHNGGVIWYENGIWQSGNSLYEVSLNYIRGMHQDGYGRFWIWKASCLMQLGVSGWQIYPNEEFLDHAPTLFGMLTDSSGVLWLSFMDFEAPITLLKWEGEHQTWYPVCELPLPSPGIKEVFRGYDGKMWIATASESGGYISIDGDAVECFGKYNTAMPCEHAHSLAQDSGLNIWVGTCIGILRTGPSGSQVFREETGVYSGRTESICAVNDEVWIGTHNGVSRYRNGVWDVLTAAEAGMDLSMTNVIKTDPSGDVWIGCNQGLCHYDHESYTCYPGSNVDDVAFSENGDVWVARGYISRLRDGIWSDFFASNSGLAENNICCVVVDNNNVLWAGSEWDISLYRYDMEHWSRLDSTNSPIDGLSINALYVDEDNTLWIGSNSLYLYNEGGLPTSSAGGDITPAVSELYAYPNPFGQEMNIRFDKKKPGKLSLSVYNIKGQEVYSKEAFLPEGEHILSWDGKDHKARNCAPGIYLIRYQDATQHLVKRILKL